MPACALERSALPCWSTNFRTPLPSDSTETDVIVYVSPAGAYLPVEASTLMPEITPKTVPSVAAAEPAVYAAAIDVISAAGWSALSLPSFSDETPLVVVVVNRADDAVVEIELPFWSVNVKPPLPSETMLTDVIVPAPDVSAPFASRFRFVIVPRTLPFCTEPPPSDAAETPWLRSSATV